MPAELVSLSESPNIVLDKPILVLGRHPECDVQLNSRKISRRHCCIAQVSDSLLVRDLGSTNGIRINGTRVVEGRLKNGDELTVGNFRFTLNLEEILGKAPIAKERPKAIHVPGIDRKPEPARPQARASHDDDSLDELDEPVELEDNSRMNPIKPIARPAAAAAPPPPSKSPPVAPPAPPSLGKPSTSPTDSASLFPDHLTLRPMSGQHPLPPESGR
jgi:pSer/pThr/pTyr-binding forkhead associated (FHA) protein